MTGNVPHFYEFGPYRLDPSAPLLLRAGRPVTLTLKALETLLFLVAHSGRVVSREELIEAVWPDVAVEENNLSVNVSMLRKALGESKDGEKYIETVPRRGYRFTATVRDVPVESIELIYTQDTRALTFIEQHSEEVQIESALKHGKTTLRRRLVSWSLAGALLLATTTAVLFFWKQGMGHAQSVTASALGATTAGFDVEGRVTTSFGFADQKAYAAVLQPDGKLVVAGVAGENIGTYDYALARYNPDGALDQTFGVGGKVVTALGPITDIAYALTLQADGKIIAAGVSFTSTGNGTRRFALARYNPDGSLDASFDSDGLVTLGLGTRSMDTIYAVALQPDGRIVVAGSASMAYELNGVTFGQNDFALARLNPDGSRDTSFGREGIVITDFSGGSDIAYALVLQPDRRIAVAGTTTNGRNQDVALARYQPDGTLDTTFGKDGKVRTDFFDEDDIAWALALQPDGRLVAAGYASHNASIDFALVRYSSNGLPDSSFGMGGKVVTALSPAGKGDDTARAVALQADGRIIVAGRTGMGVSPVFALVRYRQDGSLDTSFAGDGIANITFLQGGDAYALALRSDGLLLAAGSAGPDKSSAFAVVRFRP